ncbi:hypothetical protein NUM3379_15100 [Kineococcus sp. NUM-3379]
MVREGRVQRARRARVGDDELLHAVRRPEGAAAAHDRGHVPAAAAGCVDDGAPCAPARPEQEDAEF